jgi:hypothetical protein
MTKYILERSPIKGKKWRITTPSGKKISFGQLGYEDYTTHKDRKRKQLYLKRNFPRQDWTAKGIDTAGFWARHLLWNLTTIDESIKSIERMFGIDIVRRKN